MPFDKTQRTAPGREEYPEDADVEVDTEAENETEANVQPEEDGEEA